MMSNQMAFVVQFVMTVHLNMPPSAVMRLLTYFSRLSPFYIRSPLSADTTLPLS